jgi:hypothetical protein
MEKRVLLAVALSFLVLYGYQALSPPNRLRYCGSRGLGFDYFWHCCCSAPSRG